MSAYCDPEMADCLSIAGRGLVQIEKDMAKVQRADLGEGDSGRVHEIYTSGLILASGTSGLPWAVVNMEDMWAEGYLLTNSESEVVEFVRAVLNNPSHYTVKDGSLVRS